MVRNQSGKSIARTNSGPGVDGPASPPPPSAAAAVDQGKSSAPNAALEPALPPVGASDVYRSTSSWFNTIISLVPLLPSAFIFLRLRDGDIPTADAPVPFHHQLSTRMQLAASAVIAIGGFLTTSSLVPVIAEYTRRKGLCGKDLCKRGLFADEKDM
jgi:hypothetical protein